MIGKRISIEGYSMLPMGRIEDFDEAFLESLIGDATETAYLDFKAETYGRRDADKKELLKDVSAFTNSLGGHLILGISETDGVADGITPLTGIDVDVELGRLEAILRVGIEPKIPRLQIRRIPVAGGDVIVIEVPKSLNPPHRTTYQNHHRFYGRNSTSVYELSMEELRILFAQRQALENRAKSFRRDRVGAISLDETDFELDDRFGILIVHLIPYLDLGFSRTLSIEELKEQQNKLIPLGAHAWNSRVNLDGLSLYRPHQRKSCSGYTQIFRSGIIEAVTCDPIADTETGLVFAHHRIANYLRTSIPQYLAAMQGVGASMPIALSVSLYNCEGASFRSVTDYFPDQLDPIRRNEVNIPPSIIETEGNYEPAIREQMDFLCNAFGKERCPLYNMEGEWIGGR